MVTPLAGVRIEIELAASQSAQNQGHPPLAGVGIEIGL